MCKRKKKLRRGFSRVLKAGVTPDVAGAVAFLSEAVGDFARAASDVVVGVRKITDFFDACCERDIKVYLFLAKTVFVNDGASQPNFVGISFLFLRNETFFWYT